MKTSRRIKSFSPLFFKDSVFKKCMSVILAMAVLNLSMSCSYFTVKDAPINLKEVSSQIKEFNASEKYVIIHSDSLSWHLKDMVLNDDAQVIQGKIARINSNHVSIKPRDSKRVHRYVPKNTDPINELHFYLKNPVNYEYASEVTIPLKEIDRISYNKENPGRTITNVVGGVIGGAFVVLLLAMALKSSCPFVYIKNGEEFVFTGELYPGIITSNMQQDDFLPLPNFKPENGVYTVKISNELKEVQYTDQLQLVLINHKKNERVLMDSKGNIQTFADIQVPIGGRYDNIPSSLDLISVKDGIGFAFDTSISSENSTRYIEFDFNRSEDQDQAKLFLTVKNSEWLDYAFGKFNEQFGWYYNKFQSEQQQVGKEAIEKWVNGQNIPLSVYLKEEGNWKLVDRIRSVGPLAFRDIAIPIDLSGVEGNKVQVKLETGFMFWELDFLGIDYSNNSVLKVETVEVQSAIDHNGVEVSALLLNKDKEYLVQPNIGDEVVVTFPTLKNNVGLEKTTVYLKNRGYYNYIRDFNGIPDPEQLKSFKEDNAFTRFSEKKYFDYVNYSESKLVQND